MFPDPARPADPAKPVHLEAAALDSASVALANATRETLRMADMFETLLRGAIEVFRSGDRHRAAEISRSERIMDRLGAAIRRYLADIGSEQPLDDEDEGARGQEILSAVINLEHAADIVANNLLEFAARRARRGGGFAPQELEAIAAMHAELVQSLRLGLTVFLRGDAALREARLLMTRKRLLRRLELEATGLQSRPPQAGAVGACATAAIFCGLSATCAASIRTSRHSPTRCSNGLRKRTMIRPSRAQSWSFRCRRRSAKAPRLPLSGKSRKRRRQSSGIVDEV